jgi:hypothetical protein
MGRTEQGATRLIRVHVARVRCLGCGSTCERCDVAREDEELIKMASTIDGEGGNGAQGYFDHVLSEIFLEEIRGFRATD